jgi:hypothetical protein
MKRLTGRRPLAATVAGLLVFAYMAAAARAGTVLSDNLSNPSAGTETASGTTWLSSSFGTDASGYTLNSVTLLLEGSGQAEVSIYSDGGLEPGSLVGTLTSPNGYSSGLSDTTFTTAGIALAADSTYWVVLRAISGSFGWSWTASDSGTGAGFQDTWGQSIDGGSTWFAFDSSPTQMSVIATAAVPEPGTLVLGTVGAINLLLGYALRQRLAKSRRMSGTGRASSIR